MSENELSLQSLILTPQEALKCLRESMKRHSELVVRKKISELYDVCCVKNWDIGSRERENFKIILAEFIRLGGQDGGLSFEAWMLSGYEKSKEIPLFVEFASNNDWDILDVVIETSSFKKVLLYSLGYALSFGSPSVCQKYQVLFEEAQIECTYDDGLFLLHCSSGSFSKEITKWVLEKNQKLNIWDVSSHHFNIWESLLCNLDNEMVEENQKMKYIDWIVDIYVQNEIRLLSFGRESEKENQMTVFEKIDYLKMHHLKEKADLLDRVACFIQKKQLKFCLHQTDDFLKEVKRI